ncbi:MAG: GTP1/OBG family GTP-binding protein [Thermoprotei archaeon]|nr:MAG: GTP1/OBG family GTP-binding protein [Thermoprotei archaeon]
MSKVGTKVRDVVNYNPFHGLGIPIPNSAEDLMRSIYQKAMRVEVKLPKTLPVLVKAKRRERARIEFATKLAIEVLKRIAYTMPFVDSIHPFYRDLLSIFIPIDEYRKRLAKVKACIDVVKKISRDALVMLTIAATPQDAVKARKMFFGRVRSVFESLDEEFKLFKNLIKEMRKLPSINPEIPTIVVAGYPNVGKSSLVKAVSTAKPEIKEYPFTTKHLVLGHIDLVHDFKVQIVDTPGLLDRPLSERNKIELQAILALRHLAKVIIFLIDPTGHSGYELEPQLRLLNEVLQYFGDRPVIIAINKADLASEEELSKLKKQLEEKYKLPVFIVSAATGKGLKELMNHAIKPILDELIKKLREEAMRSTHS